MVYKLLLLELLHHRIALADALKDLPRTAEALAKEMPKIAQRLKLELIPLWRWFLRKGITILNDRLS
ncbi:MAG TPA: hypothetical protein DEV81_03195 [Cyanobacteria bacterium UBA11049]|nr:hypothetical protein [Cyanobacteria bacterium UBA11049]